VRNGQIQFAGTKSSRVRTIPIEPALEASLRAQLLVGRVGIEPTTKGL